MRADLSMFQVIAIDIIEIMVHFWPTQIFILAYDMP
jgi:hypothetical protein